MQTVGTATNGAAPLHSTLQNSRLPPPPPPVSPVSLPSPQQEANTHSPWLSSPAASATQTGAPSRSPLPPPPPTTSGAQYSYPAPSSTPNYAPPPPPAAASANSYFPVPFHLQQHQQQYQAPPQQYSQAPQVSYPATPSHMQPAQPPTYQYPTVYQQSATTTATTSADATVYALPQQHQVCFLTFPLVYFKGYLEGVSRFIVHRASVYLGG